MSKINYVEKYSNKTQKFRGGGMMGNYPSSKGPMMDMMYARGGMMMDPMMAKGGMMMDPMMSKDMMMQRGGMMEGQSMGSMNAPMYRAGMMEMGGPMEGQSHMMGRKYVAGMQGGGMMDRSMMMEKGGMMDPMMMKYMMNKSDMREPMMMDRSMMGKKRMYQEGGAMEGGGDPMADIMAAVEQVYQSQDPQMALQVVNAIYEMQMGGAEGGAAGPEAGAQMARNGLKTNTPVFKVSIKG